MLEKNRTIACFPLVSECQQHCNRGTVSRCSSTTITHQSVEQKNIFSIYIFFLTRRQSISLTEVPSVDFEKWLKYMWLNLSGLQHVRLDLSMQDFHVKIIVFFFLLHSSWIHHTSTPPPPPQNNMPPKKKKKEKKLPMPLFYPFSSTHLFPPPFIQEGLFP